MIDKDSEYQVNLIKLINKDGFKKRILGLSLSKKNIFKLFPDT